MKVTESGFIESNGFYYPPYPREQVIEMLDYLPSGTALDIGAGFGNNTKVLLDHSFKVTATETNPECITALNELSVELKGALSVIDEPLEKLSFDQQFDAVICTMVLHFLKPTAALTAVSNMQSWTKAGGINVITVYTKNNPDMGEYVSFLLETDQLKELYDGWEIIKYEEVQSGTKNPSGKSFQSAKLIARKQ